MFVVTVFKIFIGFRDNNRHKLFIEIFRKYLFVFFFMFTSKLTCGLYYNRLLSFLINISSCCSIRLIYSTRLIAAIILFFSSIQPIFTYLFLHLSRYFFHFTQTLLFINLPFHSSVSLALYVVIDVV